MTALPPLAEADRRAEVVRACLDALPADPAEVADRRDIHRLELTEMRLSRLCRSLVSAAEWHRDQLRDERLTARLDEWTEAKPRLVQKGHPC